MIEINETNLKHWSEIGSRGAFGVAMMELGASMNDLVVLTADLADATRVAQFKKKFPHKFYNVGIAEQNMIGIACGLAMTGKTVFATTFAAFASMRACEQVRTDMGYMQQNVKLVGADAGVVMGTLGNTHYAVEDVAIVRAMPYLTVLSPSDGLEIIKATLAAAHHKGPVYIRLTGAKNNPIIYREGFDYEIGKAVTLKEGNDATIIATGAMVAQSLEAARLLEAKGIAVRVIDMHTIKPLDHDVIGKAVKETGVIVTVEEHSIIGGLGSAVCEVVAEIGNAPKVIKVGLPDRFDNIGTYGKQLERFGLTVNDIANAVSDHLK